MPDVAAKDEGALIDRLLRDNRSVTASLCTKQLVNSTSSVFICHLQDSERNNLSIEYQNYNVSFRARVLISVVLLSLRNSEILLHSKLTNLNSCNVLCSS